MAVTAEGVPIDLDTVPVRIDNIHIQGLGRTKDDYVTQAVHELFKACNFNEVRIQDGFFLNVDSIFFLIGMCM